MAGLLSTIKTLTGWEALKEGTSAIRSVAEIINKTGGGDQNNVYSADDVHPKDPSEPDDPEHQPDRASSLDPSKVEIHEPYFQKAATPAVRISGDDLVRSLERLHSSIISFVEIGQKNTMAGLEYAQARLKSQDAAILKVSEKSDRLEKFYASLDEKYKRFDRELSSLKDDTKKKPEVPTTENKEDNRDATKKDGGSLLPLLGLGMFGGTALEILSGIAVVAAAADLAQGENSKIWKVTRDQLLPWLENTGWPLLQEKVLPFLDSKVDVAIKTVEGQVWPIVRDQIGPLVEQKIRDDPDIKKLKAMADAANKGGVGFTNQSWDPRNWNWLPKKGLRDEVDRLNPPAPSPPPAKELPKGGTAEGTAPAAPTHLWDEFKKAITPAPLERWLHPATPAGKPQGVIGPVIPEMLSKMFGGGTAPATRHTTPDILAPTAQTAIQTTPSTPAVTTYGPPSDNITGSSLIDWMKSITGFGMGGPGFGTEGGRVPTPGTGATFRPGIRGGNRPKDWTPGNSVVDNSGNAVDPEALAQARELSARGDTRGIQRLMMSKGYRVDSAWCGDLATFYTKAAGFMPPPGSPTASSWHKWGEGIGPEGVNVKGRPFGSLEATYYHGRYGGKQGQLLGVGETGGHVMTVEPGSYDEKTHTIMVDDTRGKRRVSVNDLDFRYAGDKAVARLKEGKDAVATTTQTPAITPEKVPVVPTADATPVQKPAEMAPITVPKVPAMMVPSDLPPAIKAKLATGGQLTQTDLAAIPPDQYKALQAKYGGMAKTMGFEFPKEQPKTPGDASALPATPTPTAGVAPLLSQRNIPAERDAAAVAGTFHIGEPGYVAQQVKAYAGAGGSSQVQQKGSQYLASERGWIKDELAKDPATKRLVAAVITHEQSGGEERTKVAESLFNRLNYLKTHGQPNITVREYLARTGNQQFYGPLRGTGRDPINEGWMQRNVDPYRKFSDAEIERAYSSNLTQGFIDQGSGTDPNVQRELQGPHLVSHGEVYGDPPWAPKAAQHREEQQRRAREGYAVDEPYGSLLTKLTPEERQRFPSTDWQRLQAPQGEDITSRFATTPPSVKDRFGGLSDKVPEPTIPTPKPSDAEREAAQAELKKQGLDFSKIGPIQRPPKDIVEATPVKVTPPEKSLVPASSRDQERGAAAAKAGGFGDYSKPTTPPGGWGSMPDHTKPGMYTGHKAVAPTVPYTGGSHPGPAGKWGHDFRDADRGSRPPNPQHHAEQRGMTPGDASHGQQRNPDGIGLCSI